MEQTRGDKGHTKGTFSHLTAPFQRAYMSPFLPTLRFTYTRPVPRHRVRPELTLEGGTVD